MCALDYVEVAPKQFYECRNASINIEMLKLIQNYICFLPLLQCSQNVQICPDISGFTLFRLLLVTYGNTVSNYYNI